MSSLEEVPESEEKLKFGAEKSDVPSKNRPKSAQNEERREKSGLRRAKNEGVSSKNRPKSGSKRGKAGKRRFWSEKGGVGER